MLQFFVNVNDMYDAVRCKLLLYADDSVFVTTRIENILSSELEHVNDWLINNKLSLHLGKTQSIEFGAKRKLCTCNTINSVCYGNVIELYSSSSPCCPSRCDKDCFSHLTIALHLKLN